MKRYVVTNRASGHCMGIYDAPDPEAALDAVARDAGLVDHAAAVQLTGTDELEALDVAREQAELEALASDPGAHEAVRIRARSALAYLAAVGRAP